MSVVMQPGRDLKCPTSGCGAVLRVEVAGGRTVDVCDACEKRRRAFPLAFRPATCTVCGNRVEKTPKKGIVPKLCSACRSAKAAHKTAEKREAAAAAEMPKIRAVR